MSYRDPIYFVSRDSHPRNVTEQKRVDRAAEFLGFRWRGGGPHFEGIVQNYKVTQVVVDRFDDDYLAVSLVVRANDYPDEAMEVELNTAADVAAFKRQVKADERDAAAMLAAY